MRNKISTGLCCLAGSLLLAACGGDSSSSALPDTATNTNVIAMPSVTGPVAVTATSYPFGAADRTLMPEDLKAVGYVEEEYFVSGKANVYDWPAPGAAVVRTPDVPYTTRVLIRRPADGKKFSGNVVVEILNASNLFDLNIAWGLSGKHFVNNGDVWVGITSKPVTAETLKRFNPQRYASLSWANPLPLSDSRNCPDTAISTIIAGDSSRTTENGLFWDMYSQVGAWLKSNEKSNPLRKEAGFTVERLYGFGYSQSGGYLYTYINAIHPLDVKRYGAPIYDAYLVAVAGGAFAGISAINQCVQPPALTDPRRQFKDVGVPIIHVMSQSDYLIGIGSRRPDSDVPVDRFRHYEMAGAGHATPGELYSAAAPADIQAAGRAVPPMACNEGPRSRFPSEIHFNAMWQNLDQWVQRGVAPPSAPPIQVVDGKPVTDAYGNVVGGLRSPFVDVPTSTWNGSSTGASFCFIAGHEIPFTSARLGQLYSSKGDYVNKVVDNAHKLVGDRFLTPRDSLQLIKEAASFNFPSP
ncbi:alpha/beta hydrolase domain-containing protein [Noviherbaspirillum sp.]|uniref:alpha/beta hydrolase domain-containing protein n=1 Tax=Noviherbaspirillum sp. TaxID=1926288 RepID=UPI002FE0BF39